VHEPTRVSESLRVTVEALRHSTLRRALLAFFVFSVGEWATWVTLLVWAYDERGVGAAAAVSVVQLVPAVLVAPLASVLGDRAHRGRALAAGYALQGFFMLLTAVALLADAPFVLTCTGGVLVTCAVTLTRPVHNAALPAISHTPAELMAGNTASITAEGAGAFLGPLTCGVMIATLGPGSVFLLFGVLLAGAAVVVVGLPVARLPPERDAGDQGLVGGALEGVRELRRAPASALLMAMVTGQYVVVGLLDILLIVLALDVLETGTSGPGVLGSALGIGAVAGAVGTVVLVGRRRLAPALLGGMLAAGLPLAALSQVGGIAAAAALLVVSGAGKAFFDVAGRTLLQRTVADEVLARIFGLQEALMTAALAVGAAIAPFLVAGLGIHGSLVVAGLVLPVAGMLSWAMLRQLDDRARTPGASFDLLRTVPFFRTASLPVVEMLSRATDDLAVNAGTAVVRQGERGDRFYVVASGTLAVIRDGEEVRRLGAGTSFGEVALLHDSARTATVIALEPTNLVTLGREEFLRSLRAVPSSRDVAAGVAQGYLDDDSQRRQPSATDE
jgi:MFS family permease